MADPLTPEDLQRLIEARSTEEERAEIKGRILAMTREERTILEEQLVNHQDLLAIVQVVSAETRKRVDTLQEEIVHLQKIVDWEKESLIQNEIRKTLRQAQNQLDIEELRSLRAKSTSLEGLVDDEEERLELLLKQEKYLKAEQDAYHDIKSELNASVGIQDEAFKSTVKWVAALQSGQAEALILKKAYAAFDAKVEAAVSKLYESAKDLVFQFDSLTKGFERQLQLGPEYTQSIQSQYQALNEYGVTIEDATKAQTDLIKTVTDFTLMTGVQQDKLREFTAVAGELGVATGDYTQGIQNSMKMMGRSVDGAIEAQGELAATARQLGLDQGEFAAKFAASGGALAKFGDQGVQAFKDLAHISKITGMELEKVLQLTNKFDTFEDAANMTGKLNAALGGNFVNAMDMMMTTDPAERFGMIRDSILDAGLSFDDMSYYQKQFYTESLGLSDVGDLAMMLSGNMDDLTDSTDQNAESLIAQKKRAQEVQNITERMDAAVADVTGSFVGMAETLSSVVGWLAKWPGLMEAIVGAILLYKGVAIAWNIVKAISIGLEIASAHAKRQDAAAAVAAAAATGSQAAATGVLAAGMGVLAAEETVLATVTGTTAAGMGLQSGAQTTLGRTAGSAVAGLQALAIPILQIGAGIGMATLGVAAMAAAFSLMTGPQMMGLAIAFTVLVAVIIAMGVFGVAAAPGIAAVGAAMLPLGFALLQIGASVFLAAAGVALMAAGLSLMFKAIDPVKILAFGSLIAGIILATPFLAIAGWGLGIFAVGLGAVGLALAIIKTDDLQAIALFTSSLAEIEIEKMNALAESIVRIAEAIKEIPISTALAMSATMTAASVVGPDIAAAVLGATGGTTGGGGGERPYNVTIQLELDGDVLAKTQKEFLGGRVRDALFGQ